jgi:dienelactone hydrolase
MERRNERGDASDPKTPTPTAAEPAPWSPPPYVALDAFVERDVLVGSSPALPGNLSVPKGEGPFPAVVLVHGSGPNDRNGTIGGNRPLQDLAWGLATRGVAALRYEKRTRVAPAGVVTSKEEVIDAVRAAVTRLAETAEIDARRIVVVGHSQGGYLAPRIAHEVPGIAAIAVLAGPTRPLEDCLVDQLDYIASLGGPAEDQIRALTAAARTARDRVRDPALRPEETVVVPPGASIPGAYFLDLRGYAPADVAARLEKPVFIAHGGRDYQVDDTDLKGWRAALPSSAIHVYPSLDHLLRPGEGKATPASYATAGHVAEEIVRDLAEWVRGVGAGQNSPSQ